MTSPPKTVRSSTRRRRRAVCARRRSLRHRQLETPGTTPRPSAGATDGAQVSMEVKRRHDLKLTKGRSVIAAGGRVRSTLERRSSSTSTSSLGRARPPLSTDCAPTRTRDSCAWIVTTLGSGCVSTSRTSTGQGYCTSSLMSSSSPWGTSSRKSRSDGRRRAGDM